MTTFTVAPPPASAITVSLPDLTRGYGQPVNLPAHVLTAGIPLTLSNGVGVSGMDLTLHYDPALLEIQAFAVASGLAANEVEAQLTFPSAGTAILQIDGEGGFASTAGALVVGTLTARVPETAAYAAKHVLDIVDLHVYDDGADPVELPAMDDDAIHVAAFLGDTNGSGSYEVKLTATGSEIRTAAGNDLSADAGDTWTTVVVGPTWRNPRHSCEVTGDGSITPDDVLTLVNDLNTSGPRNLAAAPALTPDFPPFLDPSGDGGIAAIDVLVVVNYLNTCGSGPVRPMSGGEGEYAGPLDLQGREAATPTGMTDHAADVPSAASSVVASTRPPREPQAVGPVSPPPASRTVPKVARPQPAPDTSLDLELATSELEEAISAIVAEVAQAWDSPRQGRTFPWA